MARHGVPAAVGATALVAALIAGAAGLQRFRERQYPLRTVTEESLAVTSGEALSRMTRGYNALAADLYWIRTIQYFGDVRRRLEGQVGAGTVLRRDDYPLLFPLLDITTTLDSRFNIAYRFGSIFLAEAYPGGAGRPDLAIALLEKGLRARPDKWEYMQDIGFVHYWWRHDYRAAAEWFQKAGEVPGAPWFMKSLAATTLTQGGDRESSRRMWESIRMSAEIDWLRGEADRRLMQLDVMDFVPTLQERVDRFTAQTGVPPAAWDSLIKARLIPGVPVDPSGTPYELDSAGRVLLSPTSPLFPLPEEPQRNTPSAS